MSYLGIWEKNVPNRDRLAGAQALCGNVPAHLRNSKGINLAVCRRMSQG